MKLIAKTSQKLLTVGLAAWCSAAVPAWAGGVAGATEFTQILNNVQLMMSYVEQAEQTITQMRQYQTMLQNLQQMAPSTTLDAAASKLWEDQNMARVFADLRSVVMNGQRASYSLANLDKNFGRKYPGYSGYGNGTNYSEAYRDWSDSTLDAVRNSIALVTAHADDFSSEEGMIRELQSKSRSANGQLQALQAGNAVGIQMVGQMQKLRQLHMAQMQSQNAYIAAQQSKSDADDAVMRQFVNRRTKVRSIAEIQRQQNP